MCVIFDHKREHILQRFKPAAEKKGAVSTNGSMESTWKPEFTTEKGNKRYL